MNTIGKLAVRVAPDNPNHHLWNNNGTWWCHYTLHLPDSTKERVRESLKTGDLGVARRKRDELLRAGPHENRPERTRVSVTGGASVVRPRVNRPLLLSVLLFLVSLVAVSAQTTAGQFQWPFAPTGSYHRDQWHFQFNGINNNKYHAGEDWNRGSGQDDYGDALYALADGVVAFVDKQGTAVPSIGKVVLLRYTFPDGSQVDDLRIHCAEVLVNKYDQAGNLTKVTKGQKVATIGAPTDGSTTAHLHWELHKDLNFWWYSNPYYTTVTPTVALKYLSPSLFVDDRANKQTVNLGTGWNYFQVQANAASSTAFIENGQSRVSVKRAVDAGWINGRIYVNISGVWYYYTSPEQVFFEPGLQYAVYGYRAGVLNVFYPGHNFKADRARRDIAQAAFDDTRYRTAEIKTQTYGENLAWETTWELRYLALAANGKQAAFYHISHRQNPLIRYVGVIDPDSGAFSGWREIPRNRLQ